MALASGTRLGIYEIIELLGSGGMGEVYRAHDPRLKREVAIKTVHSRSASEDSRARLWREARAGASVNHPGICQIYDIGELGDDIFVVMELLEGEPLAHRLLDGAIPLPEAVRIGIAILDALDALHRRDIVHRDLKPSNVFLTGGGIKLLDFGLARSLGAIAAGEMTITQAGTVIGTPRYMAPEQWTDAPPDPRTDLFATGLLLFEMLTGKPAFSGDDLMQVYHAIMSGQPPALTGSSTIAAVDAVIHRALEKRPADRYGSAEVMAHALRSATTSGSDMTPAPVRPTTRLVVLPFRMLRPDPDLDFLSFSLPDAIVGSLAGLQSLVVRSPLAGAKYAGSHLDLKAIASELGVDAVASGTLLRAGDQVRVSAQLVEVPSGTMLCSKTIQLALRDVFEIQDQLASAVVEALSIPLSAGEKRRLRHDLPASARAYEFYLRANQLSHDMSMLTVAEGLYRSALEEDPRYAPAWARIGRVHRMLAKFGATEGVAENLRQAGDAFARALEIDPDLSIAHNLYTLFEIETLGRSKEAMCRLLERVGARTADPELFAGLVLSCRYCGLLDASLAADRQARRLDPAVRTSVTFSHFMLGDWERAIASDMDDTRWVTKYALPMLGRTEEAIAGYKALEERQLPAAIQGLARISRYCLERRHDDFLSALDEFHSTRAFDPEGLYFAVRMLVRVDEAERALRLLEEVIDRGFYCTPALLRDPYLDPLRGEKRFTALVERAQGRTHEAQSEFHRLRGDRLLVT
jgi:serine/threonine protein kinase/tetratricopeptide (TPR) repeat protein